MAGASARVPPEFEAFIDAFVRPTMERYGAVGLTATVVVGGDVALLRAWGKRDVENDLPMRTDTVSGIGSNTKNMTAVLAAMAVDEGKLTWKQPVREYYGEWQLPTQAGTEMANMEDLLAHKIGLVRYDALLLAHATAPGLDEDKVLSLFRHMQHTHQFREGFKYNNWTASAAGWLVARQYGERWEEMVGAKLFAPLGMGSTTARLDVALQAVDEEGKTNYAVPYAPGPPGTLVRLPTDINKIMGLSNPSGIVQTTAEDMVHYLKFHLNGGVHEGRQLVSRENLDHTKRPHVGLGEMTYYIPGQESATQYGLGWRLLDYRSHHVVLHMGGSHGHYSLIWLVPDHAIAMYFNLIGSGPQLLDVLHNAIARHATDLLLGLTPSFTAEQYCTAPPKKVQFGPPFKMPNIERPAPPGTPIDHPKDYVGTYQHSVLGTIRVVEGASEGELGVEFYGLRGKLVQGVKKDVLVARLESPFDNIYPTGGFYMAFSRAAGADGGAYQTFTSELLEMEAPPVFVRVV